MRRYLIAVIVMSGLAAGGLSNAYDDKLPGWFNKLDRDGNGILDEREAGRLLTTLDDNKDGKVTAAEAIAYTERRLQNAETKGRPTARRQMLVKASEFADHQKTGDGLWVVSIGHSCVIPAVEPCISISREAGYDNHTHLMQFFGGPSGAPEAQWSHEGKKQQAKAALATGRIDVLTFGHLVDFQGRPRGCDVQDYERWIQLALEHNPQTRFFIQDLWPWLPGPERGVDLGEFSLESYEAAMDVSTKSVNEVIDQLSEKYPDRIFLLPAGLAMTELVRQFSKGELKEIDALVIDPKQKKQGARVGLYRDKIHPTEVVAALQGYLYYACLYHQNPTKLDTAYYRHDSRLDQVLREVAAKTVSDHHRTGFRNVSDPEGDDGT